MAVSAYVLIRVEADKTKSAFESLIKIRNTGRKGPVRPDEPQKRLAGPRQIIENTPSPPPRTSTPEIPRIPAEKAPKQTQHLVLKFP